MTKRTKIFHALVAVVALAFPLTGCSEKETQEVPETPESAAVEEVVEEEELEEAVDLDHEATEAAVMFVEAVKGDPKPWEEYGTEIEAENALVAEQDAIIAALTMVGEQPISEGQMTELDEAVASAFDRIEVALEATDIKDDEATVTFEIHGVNHEEGNELAAQAPEGEELLDDPETEMDDIYYYMAVKGWELAPVAKEPIVVDLKLVKDEETGKWAPERTNAFSYYDLLKRAFNDDVEGVEEVKEKYLD